MISQQHGDTGTFERELKFAVAPQDVDKLKSHPLLAAVRHSEQQLVSTYFDTAGRVLEKAGMSLRLRTSGDHIIQTLKWQAAPSSGLFVRSEYEIERSVPEPDLDYVRRHCPVRLRKELKGPLQPIMHIEVRRTVWPIRWKGGEVSVTLDEGVIRGGANSQPIHELEVEHRRGDVAAIFAVARQIAKAVPLRLEVTSKAERGYRLAGNETGGPEKARPVKLDRSMTVISAFQAIASSCIHHFAVNEAVFVAARVPEALHQMRVATRRFLSLISFCEELFSKQEQAMLDAETKRAFKTFGGARDLDIVLMALEAGEAQEIPLAVLNDIRRKREAAYARVIDMLTSQRFCLRMLDLLAFVECGSWAKAESTPRRTLGRQELHSGAARILQRQWKRLGKFGRVSHLNAKRRHRLRIDAKTFRDTCEFFGDLFAGPKPGRHRKQLLKSLYTLQDALGALNDRVSMEAILDQEPGAKGAHLMKLAGMDEVSKRALLESGGKAQRRLCKVTPFWS
jgi:triphosphatase